MGCEMNSKILLMLNSIFIVLYLVSLNYVSGNLFRFSVYFIFLSMLLNFMVGIILKLKGEKNE